MLMMMLEYQNVKIFAKGYVRNWSEEVFVIKKLKIWFRGHMLLIFLTEKKLLRPFYEKELKSKRV